MRFLHLTTVGTSIIRNAARDAVEYDILGKHAERLREWSRAAPDSFWDKDAGEHARVSSSVFRDVLAYVQSDPRRASAELNSFMGYVDLLISRGYSGVIHDIVLYPTDTGTSMFASRIIMEYLGRHGLGDEYLGKGHRVGGVEAVMVEGFGRDFWRGILNLIEKIAWRVAKSRDYDRVLVNLTAGFKPETGFLLLASSILGIDTAYYIHEYMRRIIEIPVIELELTDNMKKILSLLLTEKKLPQEIWAVTDRLGLTINGRPLPEAVRLAKTLLSIEKQ